MNSVVDDCGSELLSVKPGVDYKSDRASTFSSPFSVHNTGNARYEYDSQLDDEAEVFEGGVLISKLKGSLYEFTRKLDQGGYSEIFLGKVRRAFGLFRAYEREFVIKCCEVKERDHDEEDEESHGGRKRFRPKLSRYWQIEKEILMFKRAQGKHVVNLIEAFQVNKNEINEVYIVMEKLETGLHRIVTGPETTLEPSQIAAVVGDVLLGLNHIHAKGIVHRDIKCSNILLSKTGCVKICDFGLAGFCSPGRSLHMDNYLYGTHGFMAPEMLISNMPYDFALDVWSLGITVLFLLKGCLPYHATDVNADFSHVEWEIYKRSQEEYYIHMLGREVIDYARSRRHRDQLRRSPTLTPTQRQGIEESSRVNRDVFNFLKLALIPSPAQGWGNDRFDFTISRNVRERATVQELRETDLVQSDNITQELRKRNTILRILQDAHARSNEHTGSSRVEI